MVYLLLIFFPISMAASCFVLRRRSQLALLGAIGATLVQLVLVAQLPLDQPARLLGVTLTMTSLSQLFMLFLLSIGALAFVAAWRISHGENFVPVALLVLALVCAILLLQDLFIVTLLLIAASLAAVLMIVDLPAGAVTLLGTRAIGAALKYLVLTVIAGTLMYLGFVLSDIYQPGLAPTRIPLTRFILALLAGAFAIRLGLVPFHTWLLDLVEDAAPLTSALVIAAINTASLLVLILALQSFPDLLIDNPNGMVFLRLGGLATGLLGAFLALGQTAARRTLAYLIVYNYGMVFYGLVALSAAGLAGAIFEALNQMLSLTLVFVSLGLLERPDGRPAGTARSDMLHRWPVAGAGLLVGLLALLGLPPLNGFASKVLIYQAAAAHGWGELAALVLATALGGLAVARLARDWLLGPAEGLAEAAPLMLGETEIDRPAERRLEPEPRSTALLTLLLIACCLGIGVYPQPLLATIDRAIEGLAFIKPL